MGTTKFQLISSDTRNLANWDIFTKSKNFFDTLPLCSFSYMQFFIRKFSSRFSTNDQKSFSSESCVCSPIERETKTGRRFKRARFSWVGTVVNFQLVFMFTPAYFIQTQRNSQLFITPQGNCVLPFNCCFKAWTIRMNSIFWKILVENFGENFWMSSRKHHENLQTI